MRSLIVTVLAVVFVDCCLGVELKPYNETAYGMFLGNDPNGDGQITRLELESSFDKYDANGDGTESRHEYTEYICTVTPTLYQLSHYLFDEYDTNNDHHLRKEDYDALFATMDTNGDGLVLADEFVAYWEVIFPKYETIGVHGQSGQHGHSACH